MNSQKKVSRTFSIITSLAITVAVAVGLSGGPSFGAGGMVTGRVFVVAANNTNEGVGP